MNTPDERRKWDEYYATLPLHEEDEATAEFNRELVSVVSELLPSGRILEAGAGGGWQTLALAKTGRFHCAILDIAPAALEYSQKVFARAGVQAEFILEDALSPGRPGFDLVFNAGVLEHYTFEQQVAFVRGMASRSRNFVLALVPNRHCYWYWVWRLQKTANHDWPFGMEAPMADLSKVFGAAGVHWWGQTYLGQSWADSFIEHLPGIEPDLGRKLIELHHAPVIAASQKNYLVAALGSVAGPPPAGVQRWASGPARDEFEMATLTAAVADALASRIRAEWEMRQEREALARSVVSGIEAYRSRFRAELEVYRNQRAWQVMLMLRKAYGVLFQRGPLSFFRWAASLPWKKDWGLAEYDLEFPDVAQHMPGRIWVEGQALAGRAPTAGPAQRSAGGRDAYDVVVLPVFEFDFRHQRPQQLAKQFAAAGHRVFWVSPSRTASPQSGPYEVLPIQPNIWEIRVSSPIPNQYMGAWEDAGLKRFSACLDQFFGDWAISESCAILQLPFWRQVGLALKNEHDCKIVYDCIDHWDTFPQLGEFTRGEEAKLAAEADVLVVTGRSLFEKHANRGLKPLLVRNGADFEFFQNQRSTNGFGEIARPIIGYFGAIADWFDFDLVCYAAEQRPGYSFVLIGALGLEEKVLGKEVSKLEKYPNIHLLGHQPYDRMPSYLSQFDACMIPFRINEVTMATDPVKVYEYLSQGKPVVATAMGELVSFGDLIYVGRDRDDFVRQLDVAVNEKLGAMQRQRMEFARENSWRARYEAIHAALSRAFTLVSILIVTYNSAEFVRPCLDSIFRNTAHPRFEVVVVDNASSDGTRAVLNEYASGESRLSTEYLETNTGFARANNRAARRAKGDHLVFLNADTMVTPGWLGRLLQAARRNPGVGLVGPVTNWAGNEMRINVNYTDSVEMERFALERARGYRAQILEVGMAPLFCTLVSKTVWKRVGELDETFGIGMFEDDDYSRRVRAAGLRVICAEDCFVHHFGQGSFNQLSPDAYQRLFEQNKARFEAKWKLKWVTHRSRYSVKGKARRYTPGEFCRLSRMAMTEPVLVQAGA